MIVELDGGQHCESARDAIRDRWLQCHGYRVLRFWNNDVIENIDGVIEVIASVLPHDGRAPSPPLGGEGWGEGGGRQGQASLAHTADAQDSRPSPSPRKRAEGKRCGEE